VPGTVVIRVEIVSVEVFVVAIELLLSAVVTPAGAPLTLRETVDLNPSRLFSETTVVVFSDWTTVLEVTDA
jgi:hypothetical protein